MQRNSYLQDTRDTYRQLRFYPLVRLGASHPNGSGSELPACVPFQERTLII